MPNIATVLPSQSNIDAGSSGTRLGRDHTAGNFANFPLNASKQWAIGASVDLLTQIAIDDLNSRRRKESELLFVDFYVLLLVRETVLRGRAVRRLH
jgi:hypothetical protein